MEEFNSELPVETESSDLRKRLDFGSEGEAVSQNDPTPVPSTDKDTNLEDNNNSIK